MPSPSPTSHSLEPFAALAGGLVAAPIIDLTIKAIHSCNPTLHIPLHRLHTRHADVCTLHFILIFVLCYHNNHPKTIIMDKLEKLALMDKVLRELDDLKNSQTSVLKKLTQIEVDNINLGVGLLDKKLPDLHEEVDSSVSIVTTLLDEFKEHRDKFFADNNLGDVQNPTA